MADPTYPDADRGFEIRVSPDRRNVAIFDPSNAPWFVPDENCQGRRVRTAELDAAGWVQYVPAGADRPAGDRRERIAEALTTEWTRRAEALEAKARRERDEAHAALARVREIHAAREVAPIYPIESRLGRPGYTECGTCHQPYPCPTIRTIDGSTHE